MILVHIVYTHAWMLPARVSALMCVRVHVGGPRNGVVVVLLNYCDLVLEAPPIPQWLGPFLKVAEQGIAVIDDNMAVSVCRTVSLPDTPELHALLYF